MSDLLDDRLATIVVETQELRREVASLRDRVQQLETDLGHRTVRELTSCTSAAGTVAKTPTHSTVPPAASTAQPAPTAQSLASLVAEEVDRNSRVNNVVLRGIPEAETESLTAICSDIFPRGIDVVSAERLGRERDSDSNEESTPRPVRVRFPTLASKQTVYAKRLKMKLNGLSSSITT